MSDGGRDHKMADAYETINGVNANYNIVSAAVFWGDDTWTHIIWYRRGRISDKKVGAVGRTLTKAIIEDCPQHIVSIPW